MEIHLNSVKDKIEQLSTAAGNVGLSVGVLQEGKIIHQSHYGYQNLRTQETPDENTVYHLGSLSKAITAAGLAVLVEEGKFQWDSSLKELIPGFHQRNKYVEEQANLIDLLAHRMGLAMRMNYWAQMEQELLVPPTEAVNVLGALHSTADFRTTLKYNNWTYSLAGEIIERYSGLSLEDFMQQTFFKPLGLTRTTFAVPSEDNYASCHITLSDETPFEVSRPRIGSGTVMAGAAGLKSSLADLLRLYDALLTALEDQRKTGLTSTPDNPFKQVSMAFTPHGKKGATEYGLGWFMVNLPAEIGWIGINDGRVAQNPTIARGVDPTPVAYHNGSMPGILASVHLIPQTHTAVVICGNTLSLADIPDYAGGLILETLLGVDEPTDFLPLVTEAKESLVKGYANTKEKLAADRKLGTSHRPLDQYEGRFINPEGNFRLDVSVRGDGLRMHLQGLPRTYYDLYHYYDDVFAWTCDRDAETKRAMFPQLSDAFRKICFQVDGTGSVGSIFWAYARDEPYGEVFTRVAPGGATEGLGSVNESASL
ncbi:hypothetical protein N7462_008031 [Penicillium macrosclerotiorum]|uniref:uncharacterized protein n=1 Tax=Penicillium macrosclerotiorum TaxID=303699 RepID=UPI002547D9A3|nr:uncharacterized protein N7462_008031 [Penicillium macrosclerotiorum]KAJ5679787.1 hypothetical protein N7462_008031 [Penicillium macrosclerotiorum]